MAVRSIEEKSSMTPTSSQEPPGLTLTDEAFFQPRDLQQRQCLAPKGDGRQCCGKVGYGDLDLATKTMYRFFVSKEAEYSLSEIIRYLVCKTHRKEPESPEMQTLALKYETELVEYVNAHTFTVPVPAKPSGRNSRTTVRTKLESRINSEQFMKGYVYAFTTVYEPGYVKIGCSENPPAKRVDEWEKCYPQAKLGFSEAFDYPQRMEELIHLEMAHIEEKSFLRHLFRNIPG